MSETPDKPRRRRWRWFPITILALCGAAVAVLVVLNAIFAVNAVKPQRMQARREFLKMKPVPRTTMGPQGVIVMAAPQGSYEDFIAARGSKVAAELYPKLCREILDPNSYRGIFETSRISLPFEKKQLLEPLEREWLLAHEGTVDDILKLAESGGLPSIGGAEAAALSGKELQQLPVPNFLLVQRMSYILAGSARQSHDLFGRSPTDQRMEGVARRLGAIDKLAQSVGEPLLIHALIATQLRTLQCREIARLLNEDHWTLSVATAQQLRDELETARPADLRPAAECEYRQMRETLLTAVTSPYRDMFHQRLGNNVYFNRGIDMWFVIDEVKSGRPTGLRQYWQAATDSVAIKASADSIMRDYDAFYDKTFNVIDEPLARETEHFLTPTTRISSFQMMKTAPPNYREAIIRLATAEALRQAVLAGLDRIIDPTTGTTTRMDPFAAAPLKVIRDGGLTIIYSIGPDGQDQEGKVEYDPAKGIANAGDIVVRVRNY